MLLPEVYVLDMNWSKQMDDSSINRYFLEIQNCFKIFQTVKNFEFLKTVKFIYENL